MFDPDKQSYPGQKLRHRGWQSKNVGPVTVPSCPVSNSRRLLTISFNSLYLRIFQKVMNGREYLVNFHEVGMSMSRYS